MAPCCRHKPVKSKRPPATDEPRPHHTAPPPVGIAMKLWFVNHARSLGLAGTDEVAGKMGLGIFRFELRDNVDLPWTMLDVTPAE